MLATALVDQNVKATSEKVAIGGELIWEKTFGGTGDDRAFYATATNNGTMIVDSTKSIIANQTVAWAISVDDDGKMLWNGTYSSGKGSEFRFIINLEDGFCWSATSLKLMQTSMVL